MDIETLAKQYHEICREMVDKQIGMITKPTQPYIEWDALTEQQKDGRRFIAKNLLKRFHLDPIYQLVQCPECEFTEYRNPFDTYWCPYHGKVLKLAKEEIYICPKCGNEVHNAHTYCRICGAQRV